MVKNLISKFKNYISGDDGKFHIIKLSLLGLSMFMAILALAATLTIGAPPPDDPQPLIGIQPPIEIGSDIEMDNQAPNKTKQNN